MSFPKGIGSALKKHLLDAGDELIPKLLEPGNITAKKKELPQNYPDLCKFIRCVHNDSPWMLQHLSLTATLINITDSMVKKNAFSNEKTNQKIKLIIKRIKPFIEQTNKKHIENKKLYNAVVYAIATQKLSLRPAAIKNLIPNIQLLLNYDETYAITDVMTAILSAVCNKKTESVKENVVSNSLPSEEDSYCLSEHDLDLEESPVKMTSEMGEETAFKSIPYLLELHDKGVDIDFILQTDNFMNKIVNYGIEHFSEEKVQEQLFQILDQPETAAYVTKLTSHKLKNLKIENMELLFKKLPNTLKELHLHNIDIKDLKLIERFTELDTLKCILCTSLVDVDLLLFFPNLKDLSFYKCRKLSDIGAVVDTVLERLKRLDIRETKISKAHLCENIPKHLELLCDKTYKT